jgi:hypothetical protein
MARTGLNFVWALLNRAIRAHGQNIMIVVVPATADPPRSRTAGSKAH